MDKISDQTARDISRAIGKGLFDHHSYDAKACAQRNLSGRTHYAEDATLRFFHARIQTARPECNGLLFLMVESVAADMHNRSRGFRFVVFDLFGTVINDRPTLSPETLFKTSDKARAAGCDWLEAFDVRAHYVAAMQEQATRMQRKADDLAKCAAAIAQPVEA